MRYSICFSVLLLPAPLTTQKSTTAALILSLYHFCYAQCFKDWGRTVEEAAKLLSCFTAQSLKCAFVTCLLPLNNLEWRRFTETFMSSYFGGLEKIKDTFPNSEGALLCPVLQHKPKCLDCITLLRAWALFAESGCVLYALSLLKKKKRGRERERQKWRESKDISRGYFTCCCFWGPKRVVCSSVRNVRGWAGDDGPMFSSKKDTDCVTTSMWRCFGSKLGYWNSSISKYPSQSFVISTPLSPSGRYLAEVKCLGSFSLSST